MNTSVIAAHTTHRAKRAGHRAAQDTLFLCGILRRSLTAAFEHDILTVGQAVAYSAMFSLFPALIVAAAIIGVVPGMFPLRMQLAVFFDRVLPSNVSPVLDAYFATSHHTVHAARLLLGSVFVSIAGASSVVSTLMEGFRRAHDLPLHPGSLVQRRLRALALVPLSLIPMSLASLLVVFGHVMTHWLAGEVAPQFRIAVVAIAVVLRWGLALAGSVGIIAVIYHLGTDLTKHMRQHMEPWLALHMDSSYRSSLPGAAVATVLWFVSTLGFGLYVTRFANYSRVYGSLGAAIALMVWLYIIALCVLAGSEFNAQLHLARRESQPLLDPTEMRLDR